MKLDTKKNLRHASLVVACLGFSQCANYTEKHNQSHGHAQNNNPHHAHHHDAAALAPHLDAPDRDEWQKPALVLACFEELAGKTIMDIGAGTGYFSFKLAEAGANVIAADVDSYFLEMIEEKQKANQLSVSTRKIPFDNPIVKNKELDYALIVDTYHHIDNRIEYFSKLRKGLKKNGKLLVVDYKKDKKVTGGPSFEMRIKKTQVVSELAAAGYTKIRIRPEELPKQYIIEAFR